MTDKKIKICFIQPQLYSFFNTTLKKDFAGAEAQFYLLSKKLSEDNNFSIYCIVGNYHQKKVERYNSIIFYRSISPSSNKIILFFQAVYILYLMHKTQADIYIQRTANPVTGLIAFYCKVFKKKFIYMVACEADTDSRNKQLLNNSKINSFIYLWGLKNADLVIAQTKKQSENLLNNFKKRSISIKSPLYQIESTQPNKFKQNILWVGRIDRIKKPEIFIELAKNNYLLNFIMICPSAKEPKYTSEIYNLAKQTKNMVFVEYVPFNKINDYFQQAKILVNTSDFEGFPNTFIQAAKNKTPILSLNSNPDNFLTEYQCGLCADGNFNKLNYYLNLLVKDKELWGKYAENAYNYARENHDINKEIIKFKKNLLKLCK